MQVNLCRAEYSECPRHETLTGPQERRTCRLLSYPNMVSSKKTNHCRLFNIYFYIFQLNTFLQISYWTCHKANDHWALKIYNISNANKDVMPTAHYTTRRDNSRQENRVMCGGLRPDATRQKSGLIVSDLTMLDICDKARFLSCRYVDPRTLHDFLVGGCLVVSRRVMCGGHYCHLLHNLCCVIECLILYL